MTFTECCDIILASRANEYAKAYARAGRKMMGLEAKVQALYILNNITHWRHPDAKEIRARLKEISNAP